MQLVIFIISFFVYLPFAKRVDKLNLVKEAEAEKEGNDDDWEKERNTDMTEAFETA